MKAEEWRNLIVYYFPAIQHSLASDRLEFKVLLFFVFLFRAILLPEDEYQVSVQLLEDAKKGFLRSYQRALGEENCVFNVHIFGAHAEKFRARGSASETSCFSNEGMYSHMDDTGEKGTMSLGKQYLKGAFRASKSRRHVCQASINVMPSSRDTPQAQSSLFYTFQPPHSYKFFLCQKVLQNGNYLAKRLQISDYQTPISLNFALVGVFKFSGLESVEELVLKSEVKGFAIRAEEAIMTVPHNTITEL